MVHAVCVYAVRENTEALVQYNTKDPSIQVKRDYVHSRKIRSFYSFFFNSPNSSASEQQQNISYHVLAESADPISNRTAADVCRVFKIYFSEILSIQRNKGVPGNRCDNCSCRLTKWWTYRCRPTQMWEKTEGICMCVSVSACLNKWGTEKSSFFYHIPIKPCSLATVYSRLHISDSNISHSSLQSLIGGSVVWFPTHCGYEKWQIDATAYFWHCSRKSLELAITPRATEKFLKKRT